MFDFWYYWTRKQRWTAIIGAIVVLVLAIGGLAIKNHNDAVTRERIIAQNKKDEEAEARKRNFTTLKSPYHTEEKKNVSNTEVQKKLMNDSNKKIKDAPNEFKDSTQSKMERPDEVTMKLLNVKSPDWDNIYLTGPQFKYVAVRVIGANYATDVKVHDDQVHVLLNGGYTKKQLVKLSKRISYPLSRAFSASSYGEVADTRHVTYISGNTKYLADTFDFDAPNN